MIMDLLERAKQLRAVVQMYAAGLDDAQAVTVSSVYPVWAAGVEYAAQAIIWHGDRLYRVEQAHTAQAHQPPGGRMMPRPFGRYSRRRNRRKARCIDMQSARPPPPWHNLQ